MRLCLTMAINGAAEDHNFNTNHITQYGLLGFIQALQLVLQLGLMVLGWILCRIFGAPVPSASTRQVPNLSIIDGSQS